MKTVVTFIVLIAAGSTAWSHGGTDRIAATFHASLKPHGKWIHDSYGQKVWQPTCVPAGWQPYTVGRWLWTTNGWYWESDEPWGWATYHYGRWDLDPSRGWVWIPGLEWASSWVEWQYAGGYVAWIPLRPARRVHLYVGSRYYDHWSYVHTRNMVKHRIHKYLLSNERRHAAHGAFSSKLTGRRQALLDRRGPERSVIEKISGDRVPERKALKREEKAAAVPRLVQPGSPRSGHRQGVGQDERRSEDGKAATNDKRGRRIDRTE